MRILKKSISTLLGSATLASSAFAADWPENLMPKQVFRVEVSQNVRSDTDPTQRLTGMGIAISDALVLVPSALITPNSRFETPLAPNREIKIRYAESSEAGSDIKSWSKFRVIDGAPDGLALLEIENGPAVEQVELSACDTSSDSLAIYSFKDNDLNEPTEIGLEMADAVEPAGLERLVLSGLNDALSQADIGAPLVDSGGQVVGIVTDVIGDSQALAMMTRSFETLVPDSVEVACSDRFNSTNYALLEATVEGLIGKVQQLESDLSAQKEQHKNDVADLQVQIDNLEVELNRTDRAAFAAVSAIKDFDEKIEKIDLDMAANLLEEFKQGKPLKPRLDQISKDLGDVNWTFRVLPDERAQTITLKADYRRQLSDFPFSESLELCVTPLRQPDDPASAVARDIIDNEFFYLERDKVLQDGKTPPGAKCKWAEHNKPLVQTKSGTYQFSFDAYVKESDEDWNGLAYVQLFTTSETNETTEIVRRMVIGVSLDDETASNADTGLMECFDFSKSNLNGLEPAGELATFASTEPDQRDDVYRCS